MSTCYRSYLLRLWLEPNDPPVLRAMLESTSGERHGFASIESLFIFLVQETDCMGHGIDFTPPTKFSRQGPSQLPD
jgi:hypothetical protein